MKTERILRTNVTVGSYKNILEGVCELASTRTSSYVCFANTHMLIEAYDNPDFAKVVNDADIVAADGRPLSVFLNLARNADQERVCGMDVLPDVLREAEQRGLSVFLYGSTETMLKTMIARAAKELPRLKIAGWCSPPFRKLTTEENDRITESINASGANLVFVALGCPKQEQWMASNKGRINACMLGLGQAFNVYAGVEKRLPRWMRSLSLEWLYRLYLEPKRLWKRYLYGNAKFLALAGQQLAGRSFT